TPPSTLFPYTTLFRSGTVEQAKFPDNHFNAITLWDVIEHFDDPCSTMREIHRIMAPGGVLFVFTINQESLLNVIGHAMYRLSFKIGRAHVWTPVTVRY